MCLANGVIAKGEGVPCPLDDDGRFVDPVTDFKGMYVKVRRACVGPAWGGGGGGAVRRGEGCGATQRWLGSWGGVG